MGHWRDCVAEIRRLRVKVIQRIMNGALVSSFERWRDHILEEKQMQNKALKVELKPLYRTNQTSSTSPCSVCARLKYVHIHTYIYIRKYVHMYIV